MNNYFQANAFNIPLATGSVDLVIADPPFGIGFTGKASNYNRNSDLVREYIEFTTEADYYHSAISSMIEIQRVLKSTGTCWIIMGYTNLSHWESAARALHLNQIGHVIWKYQFGVYALRRPVVSHYHLLIYTASKKTWTWNQQGYDEDVWYIKRPYRKGGAKYPNRLPDKVIESIILRSSNVGDVVYDPFVGSGTTVKVANEMGRIGFGSDLSNNKDFWGLTNLESVV